MALKVQCSNCLTPLRVDLTAGIVSVDVPASGRGSLRTEAHTVTRDIVNDNGLLAWEAPCCPDYWDSLDPAEVEHQDRW